MRGAGQARAQDLNPAQELRVLGFCVEGCQGLESIWEFPKIRVPYFGVLIIRILLFRVRY